MNAFAVAKIVAGLIFFGGLYLFWVNRERRQIKPVEYRHGKPIGEYVADLRDARAHPKPITGRLTWFWRKRLRG
jgi:hypothetical protein